MTQPQYDLLQCFHCTKVKRFSTSAKLFEHLFTHSIIDPMTYMAKWMMALCNHRSDSDDRSNHGEWRCPELICDDRISRLTPLALLRHYLRKHAGDSGNPEDVRRCVNAALRLQQGEQLTLTPPNKTIKFRAEYVLMSYIRENNLKMVEKRKQMVLESTEQQKTLIIKLESDMRVKNDELRIMKSQLQNTTNELMKEKEGLEQLKNIVATQRLGFDNERAEMTIKKKELDKMTKSSISKTVNLKSIINRQAVRITELGRDLAKKNSEHEQQVKSLDGYITSLRIWIYYRDENALRQLDNQYWSQ